MGKNWKKRIKRIVWSVLGLGIAGILFLLALNQYVITAAKEKILSRTEAAEWAAKQEKKADCILILGAGVWDGTPSPMLKDRLEEGLALYEAGISGKILVSGDHGREGYDEVNVMKEYLIDAGVPSSDIFMDHAGFSTYESMYRAREVFQAETVVVVTQKYHLYRALYVANQLGLNAFGVGSDPRQYAGQFMRSSREALARAKDVFYVVSGKEPEYLGDIIDIHGDGDITND